MKSMKTLYFILGLALILTVYFLQPEKKPTKTHSPTQTQTVKLIDRVRQFPGLEKPNLSEQEKASSCASALEGIETLPLKTLIYDIENNRLKLDPLCFESQTKAWSALKSFPQACPIKTNNELTQECIQSLFSFKTIRIHQATADGKKMLRGVGIELRSRLPDSDSAVKAAALGYLIEDQLNKEDAQAFQELLSQVRAQFPESWDIFEMELVHLKTADQKKYEQSITDHYQSNPDSAIATYHWGCLSWQKGQAQPARELF